VESLLARAARGICVETSNRYLGAFQAYCRWSVDDKRMPESPVARLSGGNAKLDRRHDRRELTVDELLKVLESTKTSAKAFRGLTGKDRFHIYLTACGTWFRANELASLMPRSFAFDTAPPIVQLPRCVEKARPGATQPIPPGVAATLQVYVRDKPNGEPVWPGTWAKNAADMLRIGLEAAGVPYEAAGPDGPLYADYHSVRHSFITLMARSGVSPKEAQKLARHADIRLTMDRYTHLGLADLGNAVGRLPALTAPAPAIVETISVPADILKALTALAAVGGALLGCDLFEPPFAPTFAPDGDGLELVGTDDANDGEAA
jgi:integrase